MIMNEEKIEEAAKEYSADRFFENDGNISNVREISFEAGANWALQNQWRDASNDLPCNHPELIEEDNPNYTHDVLCKSEKGTLYVDYMFQSRISKEWKWSAENDCKRWMPIPSLPEKL